MSGKFGNVSVTESFRKVSGNLPTPNTFEEFQRTPSNVATANNNKTLKPCILVLVNNLSSLRMHFFMPTVSNV